MKKIIVVSFLIVVACLSCKEVPVLIDLEEREEFDTTYVVANVETPQDKMYLIEELSGVQCVNCPAGIQKLGEMSTTGEFANRLNVVSIHVGTFAWFIDGYSKQDFVVSGSEQLLAMVLGGDPGKPCASFDRLLINPINDGQLLISGYNQWPSYMVSARDSISSAPVNIHIETREDDSPDAFEITVRLHYTQAITQKQALNIYLTENDMVDAMKYALITDTTYVFNHVLRRYITPPTGKMILPDVTIEPGRVYEYKTKLKIDRNDAGQTFWNTKNMEVVVFVSSAEENTKRVFQSQYVHLQP